LDATAKIPARMTSNRLCSAYKMYLNCGFCQQISITSSLMVHPESYLQISQIIFVCMVEALDSSLFVTAIVVPNADEAITDHQHSSSNRSHYHDNKAWYITRSIRRFENQGASEIA
jgi:hypothetical protein